MTSMQRKDERAPELQVGRPAPTHAMAHPQKQVTGSYCKATERAMLKLCGVLRRIAEQDHEEMERAA